jgi:hypothetical protein
MLYSTLIDYNTPEPTIISPITSDSLFNISRQYNFERHSEGDIIWSFSNELYPGQHPSSNVPIYAISKRVNQKLYITYFTLYAYNGDYNILNIAKTGSHPCDLEHIMLEIDPNTNTLLRVLFSSHTPKDGRWVDAKDIEFENNKVVAYAALYGHGLYPKQGMIIRLLGLANDYTSKDIRWEPKVEIAYHFGDPKFNASTMGWLLYYGRMGGSIKRGDTSGIMGLADKNWIRDMDSLDDKTSTTTSSSISSSDKRKMNDDISVTTNDDVVETVINVPPKKRQVLIAEVDDDDNEPHDTTTTTTATNTTSSKEEDVGEKTYKKKDSTYLQYRGSKSSRIGGEYQAQI